MQDHDRRPLLLRVAFLVALGGADAVGQQVLGRAIDDLAGGERDIAAEFVGSAAFFLIPRVRPVIEGRAVDRLAVLAQVEPSLAVAQPGVGEVEPSAGDRALDLDPLGGGST
ncbi:MAG: hypothetical protein ACYC61_04380, partial [Isosphaeraceae bacterium]